jgi:NAD(P)H-hydrate repair Nnr-like enzyme with NAD(P)H-hydrate dehydratase domain
VSAAEVQADRVAAAQALAAQTRATVLLKGSGTVVASVGQVPSINPTGNAALATAGSGDVLAGWAAGLWAANPGLTAYDLACRAAWQHGHAADCFAAAHPQQVLRAAELIEWLVR